MQLTTSTRIHDENKVSNIRYVVLHYVFHSTLALVVVCTFEVRKR